MSHRCSTSTATIMRIRKYANQAGLKLANTLSSTYLSNPHTLMQPHICQLNHSPWDGILFPPDSASSPYQVYPSLFTLFALTDLQEPMEAPRKMHVTWIFSTIVFLQTWPLLFTKALIQQFQLYLLFYSTINYIEYYYLIWLSDCQCNWI